MVNVTDGVLKVVAKNLTNTLSLQDKYDENYEIGGWNFLYPTRKG